MSGYRKILLHEETWVVPNFQLSHESLQSHILINDTCLLDRVPETMSTDSLKYKQGRPPSHSHIVKIRLIFDIVSRGMMSQ